MPQFMRPNADTFLGNYTDQVGGVVNIFASIDEVVEDDADFIRSPASPINEVYVCALSAGADPASSVAHVMRMATAVDLASQESLDFTQQWRQGYVSEAVQGTLIASQSRTGVTSIAFLISTYTLTAAEADAITNYGNLFSRFIINRP